MILLPLPPECWNDDRHGSPRSVLCHICVGYLIQNIVYVRQKLQPLSNSAPVLICEGLISCKILSLISHVLVTIDKLQDISVTVYFSFCRSYLKTWLFIHTTQILLLIMLNNTYYLTLLT